eukprot:6211183-Pleurochrysis_carterae.AAC.2
MDACDACSMYGYKELSSTPLSVTDYNNTWIYAARVDVGSMMMACTLRAKYSCALSVPPAHNPRGVPVVSGAAAAKLSRRQSAEAQRRMRRVHC